MRLLLLLYFIFIVLFLPLVTATLLAFTSNLANGLFKLIKCNRYIFITIATLSVLFILFVPIYLAVTNSKNESFMIGPNRLTNDQFMRNLITTQGEIINDYTAGQNIYKNQNVSNTILENGIDDNIENFGSKDLPLWTPKMMQKMVDKFASKNLPLWTDKKSNLSQ